MKRWLWPDITNIEDAKKAAHGAAGVAFFVSIVTSSIILLQTYGKIRIYENINSLAFLDAGLFIAIGVGLLLKLRFAAVMGLLLYIAECFFTVGQTGRGSLIMLFFTLAFINAVRGTFAYQQFKKLEREQEPTLEPHTDEPLPPSQPILPTPAYKQRQQPLSIQNSSLSSKIPKVKVLQKRNYSPILAVLLIFFILGLGGTAYWLYLRSKDKFPKFKFFYQPKEELKGPLHTFHLKSGKEVIGVIRREDDVFYLVETVKRKEVIIIKEDLIN